MSYLRKKLKGFICCTLAIMLVFSGVVATSTQEVSADIIPATSKVRCGVGMKHSNSLFVSFAKKGDSIKKLKSSSKNLVVKQTSVVDSNYSDSRYSRLEFYAKKKGQYTITFDIHNANGKKYDSRRIEVSANGTGHVITSAKIDGKNMFTNTHYSNKYYTTKKNGKIKFSMASGCKIQKIEVLMFGKNGNVSTKSFKNGGKVTFGIYGYSYKDQDYSYTQWSKAFYAETRFNIYFYDSLTNKDRVATYYVLRPASKWY